MAERKSVIGTLIRDFNAQLTQSGADVFVTGATETGISTQANFGILVDRVEFSLSPLLLSQATPAVDVEARIALLHGDTPTVNTILDYSNDDLIALASFTIQGVAASTSDVYMPANWTWIAPPNYVVVAEQLHFVLDTTNTGQANVGAYRIFYTPIELSELDVLRLLST